MKHKLLSRIVSLALLGSADPALCQDKVRRRKGEMRALASVLVILLCILLPSVDGQPGAELNARIVGCSDQGFKDAELHAYQALLKDREEAGRVLNDATGTIEKQKKEHLSIASKRYSETLRNNVPFSAAVSEFAKDTYDQNVAEILGFRDRDLRTAQDSEVVANEAAQEEYDTKVKEAKRLYCKPMCLLHFELAPRGLHGGSHLKATVELSADAPADGVLVTLTSNHPECVLSGPPTLVPAGKRKAVIDIGTHFVDADTNFRIVTSTSLGTDTMEDYGTVKASKLIDLLVPETVPANKKGNVGKIVLDGPAGPNTRVDFGPDSHRKPTPFRHIPEFVTVPYGATEVEFKYDTSELPDGAEYQSDAMYPNLNGTVLARGIKVQR